MTRLFDAECQAGVVTVEGDPVAPVEILTQGTAASEGVLLMDGLRARYVTANTTDIVALITKMATVLGTISSTLTAIGAGMTGGSTAPPPTLAASVAQISVIVAELNALKVNLK